MFGKKRGQIYSQTFIYILALVLIGGILIFGYKSINKTRESTNQVMVAKFFSQMRNDVSVLKGDYGTEKLREYAMPEGFDTFCVVDLNRVDPDRIFSEPLVKDSVKSGVNANIFILNKGSGKFDSSFIDGIKIENFPYFSCYKARSSIVPLSLKSLGNEVIILAPPNEPDTQDTPPKPFSCAPNSPPVVFVDNVFPPGQMKPGESAHVSITVANCDTITWTRGTAGTGYKLGSQLPQDNIRWGKGRVNLPVDLAPNQKVTIPFTVTAPYAEGTYLYQWGLLNEGVAWYKPFSPPALIGVGTVITCPPAETVKNTYADATPILQNCVDATPDGKTLEIPAGTYTVLNQINISKSITLRTSGTSGNTQGCLTTGAPECVRIQAAPEFPVNRKLWDDAFGLFHIAVGHGQDGIDGVAFDHIILDGNRANRNPETGSFCEQPNNFHFCVNIGWFGDDAKIFYSASVNALAATAFGLSGKNNVFAYNLIANNGDHFTSLRWADGFTCSCEAATVMYNTFKDNSDLDVIIANAKNANIHFNKIIHESTANAAWGGLGFDNFNSNSINDFTGADISYNTIDCNYRCGFGLLLGGHPWYSSAPFNLGGYVHHNSITRARQGVNIDGFGTTEKPLRYENNIITNSGGYDTGCGWNSGKLNVAPDSLVILGTNDIPDSKRLWHDCTFYINP